MGAGSVFFSKEIRIEHLTYAYPESKEVLKDFVVLFVRGNM